MKTQPKAIEQETQTPDTMTMEQYSESRTAIAKAPAVTVTKHDKFLKIAGKRAASALRAIEILGNCANTAMYEYTSIEVEQIFIALEDIIADTRRKFEPKTRKKFGHNFFDDKLS